MRIIKITDIKESDLPLIVLADDRRGFTGWVIKHFGGNYNHSMEMHKLTHFASQNFSGFKEVPVEEYLKPSITLKFWKCKDVTTEQKENWLADIKFELSEPWWKRRYDYFGIFGQLLSKVHPKLRVLNNPWAKFCSERVRDRIFKVLSIYLLSHLSPAELNSEFKTNQRMEVFGYIMED